MKASLVYKAARWYGKITQALLYPITYHGLTLFQNMQGPFIIICNHLSARDIFVLMSAAKHYPIHFIGKKELTQNKLLGWLFNQAYMIPIQRQSADLGAVRKALATLKEGNVLGIFPEGSRYYGGDMQQAEGGIALLASMSKVPIVPVYIEKRIKMFSRTHVYFFEPFEYESMLGPKFNEQFMPKLKEYYANIVKTH